VKAKMVKDAKNGNIPAPKLVSKELGTTR
jgi:hypothetical protein